MHRCLFRSSGTTAKFANTVSQKRVKSPYPNRKNEKLVHPVIYKVKCASHDTGSLAPLCLLSWFPFVFPYKIHAHTELLQAVLRVSAHQESPLINLAMVTRVLLCNYNPLLNIFGKVTGPFLTYTHCTGSHKSLTK